jgi:fumarate reductase flavoprotein subunit
MTILRSVGATFDVSVPVAIIGAGACGLIAALAAADAGVMPMVLERDAVPAGSTALSSGFIPAAGTRFQREQGIDDTPELLAADIARKTMGLADPALVRVVSRSVGPTLEWLADKHGLAFTVLDNFLYPGHSRHRMHAHPEKTGRALLDALHAAAERAGIEIVTHARVADLYADDAGRIAGLAIVRPDGTRERIGCGALVLACNGFGGNRALVRRHIPAMADALYFGHDGNQGDAILWGEALGAATRHLGAYQGHGSVAHPHAILVTWALMTEGGIQVNALGRRFSNEHQGYSEQSVAVLAQPGAIAWDIYDERLHRLGRDFPDYCDAEAHGAVHRANDVAALAAATRLPEAALADTLAEVACCQRGRMTDRFGRDFTSQPPLAAPYYASRVTGALFHTQGGLVVNERARVLRRDGSPFPNLFAGGGAACGVSGPEVWGYLSGNGLLTAMALGRLAGDGAARDLGNSLADEC